MRAEPGADPVTRALCPWAAPAACGGVPLVVAHGTIQETAEALRQATTAPHPRTRPQHTVLAALAVLLRRQWVDNEKLAFALVQLPLEMIRGATGADRALGGHERSGVGSFLKNRLTWLGFALPALVFGFNGLHQWYPAIPEFPTEIDLNAFFSQPPVGVCCQ